ncbi:MAG: SDR family oxidoreductase [Alphaproteobacteria bacterium]|nr:SDR family oxidoreductase [Alphaproteobacteria bacterium]
MLFSSKQRFIITGASSGIGKEIALFLNRLGATVIGIGRDTGRLNEMKSNAFRPENVFVEQKDLTANIEDLSSYVKKLKEKYGKFSGMVYCAGVVPIQPLAITDINTVQNTLNINYLAPIFLAKGMADKRNNIGAGTSMVFLSSAAAYISDKGHLAYAGSKAALCAAVKSMAKEYAKNKIRMNCILPSNIRTSKSPQEYIDSQIQQYPMGFGEPIDVAELAAFLLSKEASWITGQNYVLDCCSF